MKPDVLTAWFILSKSFEMPLSNILVNLQRTLVKECKNYFKKWIPRLTSTTNLPGHCQETCPREMKNYEKGIFYNVLSRTILKKSA